ncbi:GntR family transcriptional regulator [Mycetocola sp. CAN_C7]|uniref:GntR family transcriptional regulator n=1 Tax=Mycetocola sp. CAN_C7 TaxID=2787724 RepID=UPI0018C9AC9E
MRIVVSSDSSSPIYQQIKVQARSSILSGETPVGSTLPSLRQLAAELRVSVITVTRAYNDLVAEGLVLNEHGRGFVVREIDADIASAALLESVDEALLALHTAARHARLTIADVHHRIDETWRAHD